MNAIELLEKLKADVAEQNRKAVALLQENINRLNAEPAPGKWSALQCIEHLNGYARHYLPAFEQSMARSVERKKTFVNEVKSTWLGKKCIDSVVVTNSKPMKAPTRHNHRGKSFEKKVIDNFLQHQQKLMQILEKAHEVNLEKTRTKIEIMPLFRLHLGDFLQFYVQHQTRHLAQAEKCLMVNA